MLGKFGENIRVYFRMCFSERSNQVVDAIHGDVILA
jgi:hypothetical protein